MRAKKYDDVTFTKEDLAQSAHYAMRECVRLLGLGNRTAALYYRHCAIFWEKILFGDLNQDDDWMDSDYREMVAYATKTLYGIPEGGTKE